MEHLTIGALFVPAPAQIERQQVRGRAAEPDALAKEHLATEVLARSGELEQLVLHEGREDDLLEQPVQARGQLAQQLVQLIHLLVVRLLEEPERHDHTLVQIRIVVHLDNGRRVGVGRARHGARRSAETALC